MVPVRFRRKHGILGLFLLMTACQGGMGTTPPVTPLPPQSTPGQVTQSSYKGQSVSANATATLAPDTQSLQFPAAAGFNLSVALHSPSPTPLPTVTPSSHASHKKAMKGPKPIPSPSATPTPEPSPSVTPESAKGKHRSSKGNSISEIPTVDLTFTAYPDAAPNAPTAPPSATPVPARLALVRATLRSESAFVLPSLNALAFTIPKKEETPGRGFTVTIVEELKHKRISVLAADTGALADANNVVRTTADLEPIPLEAKHRYTILLYADTLSVPSPSPFTSPAILPSGVSPSPMGSGLSPAPSASLTNPLSHGVPINGMPQR